MFTKSFFTAFTFLFSLVSWFCCFTRERVLTGVIALRAFSLLFVSAYLSCRLSALTYLSIVFCTLISLLLLTRSNLVQIFEIGLFLRLCYTTSLL
jgi:hypothetical protein